MDDRAPAVVSTQAAASPAGSSRHGRRRWGILLFAEILSASATVATLMTGQPPSPVADRYWAGVFTLATLGSASIAVLYVLCLHVLGKHPRAIAIRRAALTLSPALLGGLITAFAALDPDVAQALRVLPRLRLLIGVALGSIAAGTIWATMLWTADEGRGWLRVLRLRKAPAFYTGLAGFLVFVASGGGHLYSADEWAAYAVAHSLATRASILVRDNDPYPAAPHRRPCRHSHRRSSRQPATPSGRSYHRLLPRRSMRSRRPLARKPSATPSYTPTRNAAGHSCRCSSAPPGRPPPSLRWSGCCAAPAMASVRRSSWPGC